MRTLFSNRFGQAPLVLSVLLCSLSLYLLLALGGCGERLEKPVRGTISIAMVRDASGTSQKIAGYADLASRSLHRRLAYSTESGQVVPDALRAWTMRSDALLYVLEIKPNLRWSDGSQLGSPDLALALQNVPAILSRIVSMVQLNPLTLEVRLSEPIPDLILRMAHADVTLLSSTDDTVSGLYAGQPAEGPEAAANAPVPELLIPVGDDSSPALRFLRFDSVESAVADLASGRIDMVYLGTNPVPAVLPEGSTVLRFMHRAEQYLMSARVLYQGPVETEHFLVPGFLTVAGSEVPESR